MFLDSLLLKVREAWGPRKSRANKKSEVATPDPTLTPPDRTPTPPDPPRTPLRFETPLKTPSKAETGLMGWLKLKKEEPGEWICRDRPVKDRVAEQEQRRQTEVAELPGYQFTSPTPPAMKEVGLMRKEPSRQIRLKFLFTN